MCSSDLRRRGQSQVGGSESGDSASSQTRTGPRTLTEMRSSPTTADAREDADLPADNVGQASPPSCGILRSPRDTLHFARSTEYFPLTLTLSLREREPELPVVCLVHTGSASAIAGMSERRRTILPLPRGEGRGGEAIVVHPTIYSVRWYDSVQWRRLTGPAS